MQRACTFTGRTTRIFSGFVALWISCWSVAGPALLAAGFSGKESLPVELRARHAPTEQAICASDHARSIHFGLKHVGMPAAAHQQHLEIGSHGSSRSILIFVYDPIRVPQDRGPPVRGL